MPSDVIRMYAMTLETDRLLLRQFCERDFDDYEKMTANIDVMRYLGGKTYVGVEAWRHMAFLVGHWQLRGYGYYAAEEKSTGKLVGRIGFGNPTGWPGFELGWTLAPEHQGHGFATEAARRLLDYAFNEMDRSHLISLIHPDNTPSLRVAERLGEKVEGETEVLGMPVLIYGIDRTDSQGDR